MHAFLQIFLLAEPGKLWAWRVIQCQDPVLETIHYQKCFYFLHFHCSAVDFCDNDVISVILSMKSQRNLT